ncbi:hypothetical protein [Spirosoma sp. KUDC1026]|uniref:hypothetical protein n=1 Tax=Spirosoma sp. KUDC1026 TaxID=2745947 RepID=UPI00159BBED4|nr:hypothetical protein [Spirosoma sp. KUDC1026]QKZ13810.1 hypothetical protein HU175_14690 [Spirosoma sp. KUDC1026]
MNQKQFAKLLDLLPQTYEQIYGQSVEQRQAECPEQPTLRSYEELILFNLFFLKSAFSFDLLAFTTDIDDSTPNPIKILVYW